MALRKSIRRIAGNARDGIIRSIAAAAGYDASPRWAPGDLASARRLRYLLDALHVVQVLDIGANRGGFRDHLRSTVGFPGRIHSFEPDPDLAAHCLARAKADRDAAWRVSPVALGSEPGRLTLNRMRQSVYNSFLLPQDTPEHPGNAVMERLEVEVRTLDGMLPELGDLSRCFVKIDTQGFDLEVLKGGRRAFAQVPLVQTEISFRGIYQGMPGYAASLSAFAEAGFEVADMFLVNGPERQIAATEFDCLLVRRDRC
jgi:FkbM family methyltransferase